MKMIRNKYSVENIVGEISKLQPEEFIGVCKILGISLMVDEETPKEAGTLFEDVIGKLNTMNRTQRKNLIKILRAANEDR